MPSIAWHIGIDQLPLTNGQTCTKQLIVANRSVKRPSPRRHERGLLALLASIIPGWRNALLIVKPGPGYDFYYY